MSFLFEGKWLSSPSLLPRDPSASPSFSSPPFSASPSLSLPPFSIVLGVLPTAKTLIRKTPISLYHRNPLRFRIPQPNSTPIASSIAAPELAQTEPEGIKGVPMTWLNWPRSKVEASKCMILICRSSPYALWCNNGPCPLPTLKILASAKMAISYCTTLKYLQGLEFVIIEQRIWAFLASFWVPTSASPSRWRAKSVRRENWLCGDSAKINTTDFRRKGIGEIAEISTNLWKIRSFSSGFADNS